jgi:hypothetical protein
MGVVVATGDTAEIGKISKMVNQVGLKAGCGREDAAFPIR